MGFTVRKRFLPLALALTFMLGACSPAPTPSEEESNETLSVVATTYPIFLFASELTKGVEGISVTPLVNQSLSCLHNYTMTVNDMKTLESADLVLMNGAGLDDFLLDATLSNPNVLRATCTADIPHFLGTEVETHDHHHDAHDHDDHQHGEDDPHVWMDPNNAIYMVNTIANALTSLDPAHESDYRTNAEAAVITLQETYARNLEALSSLTHRNLITVHDGFAYFADAFNLNLLLSIEEEEGQEASAKVIAQALALINDNGIPAIFTEEYSADSTAKAIARESGVAIFSLSMMMSGPVEGAGLDT